MNRKLLKKISLMLVGLFFMSVSGFSDSFSSVDNTQQNMIMQDLSSQNNSGASNQANLLSQKKDIVNQQRKMIPADKDASAFNAKNNLLFMGSDLEKYFNKIIFEEQEIYRFEPLRQFGYDIFRPVSVTVNANSDQQTGLSGLNMADAVGKQMSGLGVAGLLGQQAGGLSSPSSSSDQLVSPDYIVGPGDSFAITMWGVSEGTFNVQIDAQGNIVLPKTGVVSVSGLRYGELQDFIESQLSKYYNQVNVSVAVKNITGVRIYVVGEVSRPGTYNTSSLSTVYNALFLAGGPTKRGSMRDIRVMRNGHTVAHVDLYQFFLYGNRNQDINLIAGDTIFVPVIGPVIAVAGNVRRSGIFEIKSDTDLSDIINMAGGILPTSYINRVHIQRVQAHEKRVVVDKQFNFAEKNPRFYVSVKDMDMVKVYPIYSIVDNVLYLEGAVKYPGPYQWRAGMTVKDVIPSASDLVLGAYMPRGEIIRQNRSSYETSVISFNLGRLLSGDNSQNVSLEAGDVVSVSSEKKMTGRISIEGEVRLPGGYVIAKGERLSSVLKRAGGFTDQAYLFGAVFTRKAAQQVQAKAFNDLMSKMETDLIAKEGDISGPGEAAENIALRQQENLVNRQLLDNLKRTTIIEGRVIINLKDPDVMAGTKDDIEIEDGDRLVVPKIPNTINVLGEVYSPSSVVFNQGKPASYYLAKVGGMTSQANTGDVYLVRADGSILSRRQGVNIQAAVLLPGDSMLVPKSFDKFDFWVGVKDFTHWFYEATLAFAVFATYLKK
jgi:protein involved in polysaccharide export with SLBB domain